MVHCGSVAQAGGEVRVPDVLNANLDPDGEYKFIVPDADCDAMAELDMTAADITTMRARYLNIY